MDILKLWPFTRLNPLPIRKTSNEQMFKQGPTGQLKKGNIIHRMDDVANIGFGFTMLFGYSRLIAVKKCWMETNICEFQKQEDMAIPTRKNPIIYTKVLH